MKKIKKDKSESVAENHYDLKTEAVDALVNADSEEPPKYTEEEMRRYRSKSGLHIPGAVKILFTKAWFAGAVCFFFVWGLGIVNPLDIIVVIGIILGLITDLFTNNVIHFFEGTPGENDCWLMIHKRGVLGLLLNIVYSFLVLFCVIMLYNGIDLLLIAIAGSAEKALNLPIEPVMFGVFSMGFDMLFIGIRRWIENIVSNAKSKKNA